MIFSFYQRISLFCCSKYRVEGKKISSVTFEVVDLCLKCIIACINFFNGKQNPHQKASNVKILFCNFSEIIRNTRQHMEKHDLSCIKTQHSLSCLLFVLLRGLKNIIIHTVLLDFCSPKLLFVNKLCDMISGMTQKAFFTFSARGYVYQTNLA